MLRRATDELCDSLLVSAKRLQVDLAEIHKDLERTASIRDAFFINTSQTMYTYSDVASNIESLAAVVPSQAILSTLEDTLSKINMQTGVLVADLQKYGYEPPARPQVPQATTDHGHDAPLDNASIYHSDAEHEPHQQPEADISIRMDEPVQAPRAQSRSPSPPALESLGLSSMAMQLIKFDSADSGRESEELTAPSTPKSLYSRFGTDSDSSNITTPPVLSSWKNSRRSANQSPGARVSESSSRASSMHPLIDSIHAYDMQQLDQYLRSQVSEELLNEYVAEINELTTDKRFMSVDAVDDTFTLDEISQLALDKKHSKAKAVLVALIGLKRIGTEARGSLKVYHIL
ncbi:hypothetical protein SeLEV6574_g02658 [Synchytrium endobioticum]|uniref:Spindle and kinetochore-associated protein 3 n=1 Tax=Synchytrium endobioticum TaxID=286115 RepID=A0A507D7L2_9FUNG|nr:hypothetical protein SeLEV6574_g02658 [Synchytrium endobioticum]